MKTERRFTFFFAAQPYNLNTVHIDHFVSHQRCSISSWMFYLACYDSYLPLYQLSRQKINNESIVYVGHLTVVLSAAGLLLN